MPPIVYASNSYGADKSVDEVLITVFGNYIFYIVRLRNQQIPRKSTKPMYFLGSLCPLEEVWVFKQMNTFPFETRLLKARPTRGYMAVEGLLIRHTGWFLHHRVVNAQ